LYQLAIGQLKTALLADRQDGPDQVLVAPHATGNAVHQDRENSLLHFFVGIALLPFGKFQKRTTQSFEPPR
jgi:hypothetical protein